MGKGSSLYVITLQKFVAHKHCGSGDMFLIYYVISQDNVTWELFFLMGRSPLR